MPQTFTDSRLANLGARAIYHAFDGYHGQFKTITRRARTHFERCDWRAMRVDGAARLDLYSEVVARTVADIHTLLAARSNNKLIWASIKAVYSGLIAPRDDRELGETFLNSITRRIFATVGVDPQIEFVDTDFDAPPSVSAEPMLRTYVAPRSPEALVENILADYAFAMDYETRAHDAKLAAAAIARYLDGHGSPPAIERAEMLRSVFYRGIRAYFIGRLWCDGVPVPLVLALQNGTNGIVVDAVLCTEDDVSILFSFTRAYFHVETPRPHDLVLFLQEIMPRKPVAELYIAIGYNRHGKTELYRHLIHHLNSTDEQFIVAPGAPGMVMLVFTLPSYDVVCKIIRDRFDDPKTATRAQVMEKYSLVFKHDRAGRLIDAQEFDHLEFDRARFSEPLLDEMRRGALNTVRVDGERVVINHLYIERRVRPLDIHVREATDGAGRDAVIDYGRAIKELAAANIFPGDLLLKNFGVTRHGRVVFYDYDELCLLTECKFRTVPTPHDSIEELSAEPWFFVGEHDCFPSEFKTWLGLQEPLLSEFLRHHADLYKADFWNALQVRIRAGEVIDILPYSPSRRLETKQE